MSTASELTVPRRFRGPPSSGNGGWTSGALARLVAVDGRRAGSWPAITVSLRQPPPLDSAMPVTRTAAETVASFGGVVVARASVAARDPAVVEPVGAEEAEAARAAYPGLAHHPFPTCFACGTDRAPGDGLRIWPGRVGDAPDTGALRVASTWTPDPSLAEGRPGPADDVRHASLATTWAALDCVSAWTDDLAERPLVLAAMTARVDALPVVGEEHVVVGAARGQEGRRVLTSSTLYDPDGRVVACAEHVWVRVDPARFGRPGTGS